MKQFNEYVAVGDLHVNIVPLYEAFGVRPGDGMYRPGPARVQIW